MSEQTKVQAFRQLHTPEEVEAAFAAGDRVEFSAHGANSADPDRIDAPACSAPDAGGWVRACAVGFTHYDALLRDGCMYRAAARVGVTP